MARTFLHQGGGLQGVRFWNRRGFRILMYHDFPAVPGLQEALAKQCAHIARNYEVVSLTYIGRHLREGRPLPKNALAVTVDDGNRDFLLNGYPIFNSHKIPVTVFVVSGFLDQQLWFWWDQVMYLMGKSPRTSFEFSLAPGQPPRQFSIATPEERQRATTTITEALKALSTDDRHKALHEELENILHVKLPMEPPPHMAPMTWSEVRHLTENGVDVGAHTVTHPVLSRIKDHDQLIREVAESKKRIEEELHRPVLHFCYPYGLKSDFDDRVVKVVEQCGFQTAVTAEHGLNTMTSPPFQLRRFSIDPMLPEFYFQERLAGLHTG